MKKLGVALMAVAVVSLVSGLAHAQTYDECELTCDAYCTDTGHGSPGSGQAACEVACINYKKQHCNNSGNEQANLDRVKAFRGETAVVFASTPIRH